MARRTSLRAVGVSCIFGIALYLSFLFLGRLLPATYIVQFTVSTAILADPSPLCIAA
ncbi:hypothetical protein B0H12DRAFT_1166119 [Mycena haematopus]|nr:hypothetical protein B0H12DRAFT_1166119 [Mycena haematopus]